MSAKLSITEMRLREELEQLRQSQTATMRQLAKAKNKLDALVDASMEGAKAAMLAHGPLPAVPKPKADNRKNKTVEAALWHLTDWQGAKLTTSYNSDVMVRRVHEYCDVAEQITGIQRADHPVRTCAIAFGGDMIEGLFNFPTQPYEIDATLFEQFVNVGNLVAYVVRRALAIYEKVLVVPEWGNHGRIGSKRSAVPRADNADRMTYELARQMVGDDPRLTWQQCPEDIQHLEVGNYRALVIHGDEIGRNGFASLATIVQHVNRWRSGAHRWEFRDVYVGHYHTHYESALANGEGSVYGTGSTESDNRYAGINLASSALPSQRLNFINPKRGRVTYSTKVWLDSDVAEAA